MSSMGLSTADQEGGVAYIRDIQTERGPPLGEQVWTTYNFEVADWHTYFVGNQGLWVHNRGVDCQTLMSFVNWEITTGTDELLTYSKMLDMFPETSPAQKGAIVEDLVRSRNPNANIEPNYIFVKHRYLRDTPDLTDHERHLTNPILHWKNGNGKASCCIWTIQLYILNVLSSLAISLS